MKASGSTNAHDGLDAATRQRLPMISVVTPAWNDSDTILRAIRSVRAQTWQHWELLVVDDCSSDSTWELVQAAARHEARIRTFRTRVNLGPSAARNLALHHARGEWIVYLDADDEFYPDYLETVSQMRCLADVLVFGYDVFVDVLGAEPVPVARYYPCSEIPWLLGRNVATPLGVAHARRLLDRSGFFDEELWCLEDWELWQRFARCGAIFAYVEKTSGRYYIRPNSRSRMPRPSSAQARKWNCTVPPPALYSCADSRPTLRAPRNTTVVIGAFPEEVRTPSEAFLWIPRIQAMLRADGLDVRCFPERALWNEAIGYPEVATESPAATDPFSPTAAMTAWWEFLRSAAASVVILVGDHPELEGMAEVAHALDLPVVLVPGSSGPMPPVLLNVDYTVCYCERERYRLWTQRAIHAVLLMRPPAVRLPSPNQASCAPLVTVFGCGPGERATETARRLAGRTKQPVRILIDREGSYLVSTALAASGGRAYAGQWRRVTRLGDVLSGNTWVVAPDAELECCPRALLEAAAGAGVRLVSPAGHPVGPSICQEAIEFCAREALDLETLPTLVRGSISCDDAAITCNHVACDARDWRTFLRHALRQPGPPCVPYPGTGLV